VNSRQDGLSVEGSTGAPRGGEISRRRFLKGASALGMSLSAAPLFAACGEQRSPSPGGPSGGSLAVSFTDSTASLDPAFGINLIEGAAVQLIFDNLVRINNDLDLEPMVATDWSRNKDATRWTFKLRDDVKFSNGRKVVADDIVFTIERVLDPDTASPGASIYGLVEAAEAKDDTTLVFNLRSPFAEFPRELAQPFGAIVPKEAVDRLENEPVGSGPFELAEYVPGSQVVVRRRDDYWDADVIRIDEVVLRTMPDEVTQTTALQNGEIQIFFDVPANSYEQVKATEGVSISERPSGYWVPLVMRVDTEPFDNPRVRTAIKYAVNRPEFVKGVLFGQGVTANDHPIPPNYEAYWDAEPKEQDLDQAKTLLAEAGLADGFEFEVVAATDRPERADTAVLLSDQLKQVGINFKVKTIDYDTYISQVYGKGPLYIGLWRGNRATLEDSLVPFFTTDGSRNEYAYSNEQLDETLFAARKELDEQRRIELYKDAQRIISEDGPALIPYFGNVARAYREEVTGFEAHPLGYFNVRDVALQA
jgi:peptide/nickel transport system substrate-binding protein